MTNKKIRIAVRLKDGTKRLYGLEDHGLSILEMQTAVLAEVKDVATVLISLPSPVVLLEPEVA